MARYGYTPTKPDGIQKSLTELFTALEGGRDEGGGKSTYNRSANATMIAVVSSVAQADLLDPILDEIALVQPSRFFVLFPGENGVLDVGLSARCHGIAKGQHVCSEVIRVAVPTEHPGGLASLLRAQAVTGTTTDLLLLDGAAPEGLISAVLPLSDGVIIDSAAFAGRPTLAARLRQRRGVVDLSWIALGPWRDAVRFVFERHAAVEVLPYLQSITVDTVGAVAPAEVYASLFTGWIAARLKLSPLGLGRFDGSGASLKGLGTAPVLARLNCQEQAMECRLQRVRFEFAVPWGGIGLVQIERRTQLEITIDLGVRMTTNRPADDDTVLARLRRHFSIGESLSNYGAAVEQAQRLLEGTTSGAIPH